MELDPERNFVDFFGQGKICLCPGFEYQDISVRAAGEKVESTRPQPLADFSGHVRLPGYNQSPGDVWWG